MSKQRRGWILFFAAVFMIFTLFLTVSAAHGEAAEAPVLTGSLSVSISGGQNTGYILDDSIYSYLSLPGDLTISISREDGIAGLYIIWNKVPGKWTYTINGVSYEAGSNGFLHEYIELPEKTTGLEIHIPEDGAELTDIHCFGEGAVPEWVQIWEPPCERADIMLLSTHADDEQLFFAGILPYYAGEVGAAVQVVYMTNHWDTVTRPHEQLNGLWTAGIRNYPVIGPFSDDAASLGSKSESVETVLERALRVYDEEALVRYQVEMIRRFQPQVIIGHDEAGEYRHGAHIVNTYTLKKALEISGDGSYYPDLADKYGLWDVPKTYLHLYGENRITMDWDIPLESFGGLTAFEVSKLGYGCHLSQQWTWFTGWIERDKASDIENYSPCLYGLYRTAVGEDSGKNDFLENITTYREQEEILARENAEHIAAEEAERVAAEEAARIEEVTEANGEEHDAGAAGPVRSLDLLFICSGGVLFVSIICLFCFPARAKKREGRKKP